uniref:AT-hook motif nuclear-localized protein n=1 Tax=Solanum lycopersicum TaxID=4081 RepID=A0A3Q7JU89_SOLLC
METKASPLSDQFRVFEKLEGSTGFGFLPRIIEVRKGEPAIILMTQNTLSRCGIKSTVIYSELSSGLCVSFAKSNGWVFGGSAMGVLTAASPIQIIVGELVANGQVPTTTNQQQIPGSIGLGVTQHIITVKTGEDVSSKILSFIHSSPRAVCIVSATGELSNVTVLQADASGGMATYEGLFKILTLSGSFLPLENGDRQSRMGELSVIVRSFAAPAALMDPKFVGPSRGMHSGLPTVLTGHPKGKRSGNRKR